MDDEVVVEGGGVVDAEALHERDRGVKVETNPVNYRLSASAFLAEIGRMQLEFCEYPSLHAREHAARARDPQ